MKYIAFILVLIAGAAHAQYPVEGQYIGGGFSLYTPLAGADTSSSFGIDVEYFRMTSANTAFGLRAGYNDDRSGRSSFLDSTYGQGQYFIAPNLQRFFPIIGRFGVLVGLEAVLSYQQTKTFARNVETAKGNTIGLAGNLFTGAYFQASDRLFLRLNIGRAGLLNVSQISQELNQSDVKTSTLTYRVTPTYSIAGSSLSLFYRF